ncbi:MAG: T9SS type A sorting domain-containing protein [Bacteroidia bacterium]|nr:T9SS type A sorting domain-containing protein [Bacteroidia bacterium]
MKNISLITLVIVLFLNPFAKSQAPTFQWAKQISGSTGNDLVECIVSDKFGNTYSTGYYAGNSDFDPGPGTYTLPVYGNQDAYILKLDPSGNIVWAKGFGSSAWESSFGICLDNSGNIFVTGYFMGACDFDPGPSSFILNSVAGGTDAFIAKFSPIGNLLWAKQIGNLNGEIGYDLEADDLGNVYTTGYFEGTVDFDPGPGAYNLSSTGGGNTPDIFISKLDSNGNFVWAKQVMGMGADYGYAVALDKNKNVIISGYFAFSADFDPGPGIINLTSAGGDDAFVLKLDSLGNYIWAINFESSNGCYAYGVDTDTLDNVVVSGLITSITDFDPSPGTYTLTSPTGAGDTFIAKFSQSGNFVWAQALDGLNGNIAYDITTDQLNNVYSTGFFQDTIDFDPGPGVYQLTPNGSWDIYALKLDPNGNFKWVITMGGKKLDNGQAICTNALNEVFVAGFFDTIVDFDPGPAIFNLITTGTDDAFIVKLIDLTTEVPNLTKDVSHNLYPNPFTNFILIELAAEAQIIITNVLGQEILNEKRSFGKQIINLQDQSDGIYFVKVIQEGKQSINKIIKE